MSRNYRVECDKYRFFVMITVQVVQVLLDMVK